MPKFKHYWSIISCWSSAKKRICHLEGPKKYLGGGNSNIFGSFIPKIGVSWSNLTSIFFRWVETFNRELGYVFVSHSLPPFKAILQQPGVALAVWMPKVTDDADQRLHQGFPHQQFHLPKKNPPQVRQLGRNKFLIWVFFLFFFGMIFG